MKILCSTWALPRQVLASGRKIMSSSSPAEADAPRVVKQVLKITRGWRFDAVSIGYPGWSTAASRARAYTWVRAGSASIFGRVRSPRQDHQRRGDAGVATTRRKDALPGLGTGLGRRSSSTA